MKLNWKCFALSVGCAWALGQLLAGWIAIFGRGEDYVEVMSSLYIGFKPSFVGGIIGALWGFLDGFIFGAILSGTYNAFLGKAKSSPRKRK